VARIKTDISSVVVDSLYFAFYSSYITVSVAYPGILFVGGGQ